ncbi:hypothetical protein BGZ60DRAFT_382307 [Tricladium varicosporioides]|nr:hypothetical protein BGZ60DRAFT_382307 [Hymenoscyphus varicosporioides]
MNEIVDCEVSREQRAQERKPRVTFQNLPTELHLMISKNLIYPDALALKHTNRHFYCLVDTGINLKVDWLEWRFKLHLYCPRDNRCDLGSDQRFCRGSYRLLMQRYREHDECDVTGREGGRGCLVYGTKICTSRKELTRFGKAKKFAQGLRSWNVLLWWFSVAVAGLLMAWIWMMKYPAFTSRLNGNTTETGTVPTPTVDATTI